MQIIIQRRVSEFPTLMLFILHICLRGGRHDGLYGAGNFYLSFVINGLLAYRD